MYGKNVSQVVKYVEPLVPHTRISESSVKK